MTKSWYRGVCVVTRQKRSSVNCGISKWDRLSDRQPSLERALILITISTTDPFIIVILLQCHLPATCFGIKLILSTSCSPIHSQPSPLLLGFVQSKESGVVLPCRALAANQCRINFAKIGNKKTYSTCQYIYLSWPAKQQTRLLKLLRWREIINNTYFTCWPIARLKKVLKNFCPHLHPSIFHFSPNECE